MSAFIKAISYELPKQIVTNADLCLIDPTQTGDGIFRKTGIRKRHVLEPNQLASD